MKIFAYVVFALILEQFPRDLLTGRYLLALIDIACLFMLALDLAIMADQPKSLIWQRLLKITQAIIIIVVTWLFPFLWARLREDMSENIEGLQRQLDLVHVDLLGRAEKAEGEVARLQDQNLRIMRGEFLQCCSYCGHEFPASGEYAWEDLQAHILVCPHHPVGKLTAALEQSQADYDECLDVLKRTREAERVANSNTRAYSDMLDNLNLENSNLAIENFGLIIEVNKLKLANNDLEAAALWHE